MKKNEERGDNHNEKKRMMMRRKNISRLGGGGLSLDTFANAKSKNNHYNPALIKKQREFYKNAKNVNKFKKLLKQQNQQNGPTLPQGHEENVNETDEYKDKSEERRRMKSSAFSLEELYKKQHEEKEKERMEREAVLRVKKEEREQAEGRRKTMREKMLKKTRRGQPVMKYRIEHLLETIQGSTKNAAGSKS
ncbi:unnamed protein product [Sphenostylis stenocarpa]|uniref:rRNA-processing protein FYV7 n=1 Tax=Sphenostylis stenocarpa TaxID=92480 RepID=A0AA86V2L3_9FABA|nr:unnamed protein product [Sphenostylis stenocarpa]